MAADQVQIKQTWRKIRASWRDTVVLLREFRRPLLFYILLIASSGWLYFLLARRAGEGLGSLAEAIYLTLALTFFQPTVAFPSAWYLQLFFFAMPVVGVWILAQGLTDFGVLLFNRRARGKEWEMAVASTYNNHVVVIGLGHLGFRVVKKLHELNQDVVMVERNPNPDLLQAVHAMNLPVLIDDGVRDSALQAAGVSRARAIILCTQDDSLNLRMALKARSLNPKIEVIIRIFDDDFASSLQTQFGFHAMSATSMAAPLFAAVAAHVDITPPITIEGQPHIMAQMQIGETSHLRGKTINAIEEKYHLSVILLCKDGSRHFHPAGAETVATGHTIAIFGEPERINQLLYENKR